MSQKGIPTEFAEFLREENEPAAAEPTSGVVDRAVDEATESLADVATGRFVLPPEERPLYCAPGYTSDPHWRTVREKPIHRAVIFLKAQGLSNREISTRLGIHWVTVCNIVRQPWAAKQIVEEIAKAGRGEVETLLEGAVADSIVKLINLRDDDDAPKDVQRKSANDLLDRFYGKPNQKIITASVDPNDLSDAELAEIARKGLSKTN
ncbi:MAG TPA: hypothetical protein VIV60_30550 [Polyangiaceae bacterium]